MESKYPPRNLIDTAVSICIPNYKKFICIDNGLIALRGDRGRRDNQWVYLIIHKVTMHIELHSQALVIQSQNSPADSRTKFVLFFYFFDFLF
jgi:hypothetical protein